MPTQEVNEETRPVVDLESEERFVADLDRLGVSYLSRQTRNADILGAAHLRPSALLAALVQQPSARVRSASIALLLAHPSCWRELGDALSDLSTEDRATLKLFYTAAALLQQEHEVALRDHLGARWMALPDLYSDELGLEPRSSPAGGLQALAAVHRDMTGRRLNWEGTYRQAAHQLLRQWSLGE